MEKLNNHLANVKNRFNMIKDEKYFFSPSLKVILTSISCTFSFYLIYSILMHTLTTMMNVRSKDSFGFSLFQITNILALICFAIFSELYKSLMIFLCFVSSLFIITVSRLADTFSTTNETYSNTFIYSLLIIISNISTICYILAYIYPELSFNSQNLNEIVYELNLKIDMLKVTFNSIVINCNLHKTFPSLLFRKQDYYFMRNKPLVNNEYAEKSDNKNQNNSQEYEDASTLDNTNFYQMMS
jgi:hypothetical protein